MLCICRTNGSGYWSDRSCSVVVTDLTVFHWLDDEYGELRVVFDTSTWEVKDHGFIYTDSLWLSDLRGFLMSQGFTQAEANDIDYSEHGMQGIDYVSLDAGPKFLKACDPLMQFLNKRNPITLPIRVDEL